MAESNQARYFRPDPIPSDLRNAFSRWVDQQLRRVEIASGTQTIVVNNHETKIVYLEGNDTVQDGRLDVQDGRLDALEALPPMRMLAPYLGTETVPAGTVVSDNGWLMHANQDTSERAAPQPAGPPSWEMPDIPAFTEQQSPAVIWSGHEYTLTVGGWMQEVQIWVPELTNNTNYRILLIDQTDPANPIVNAVEEPILRENAWTSISLGSKVYPAGSNLAIIIDALNSGSSNSDNGFWTRAADNNNIGNDPGVSNWATQANDASLRINKTDLNTADRDADLLSIITGSTIAITSVAEPNRGMTWVVNVDPVDQTTHVSWGDVVYQGAGVFGEPLIGEDCLVTWTIPVASQTKYVEQTSYWPFNDPVWATMRGILRIGGVDQPADTTAFGVRLKFQPGAVSTHWDFMALSD